MVNSMSDLKAFWVWTACIAINIVAAINAINLSITTNFSMWKLVGLICAVLSVWIVIFGIIAIYCFLMIEEGE